MAELIDADAVVLQVLAEIVPFLEQRDAGALVVLEGQDLAKARDRIVAQFALDAVLLQLAGEVLEVGTGCDLERQHDAAFGIGLVELDGELADLGGEEGAILLALGEDEADDLGIVVDHTIEIGGFVDGVSDAARLDHGIFSNCWAFLSQERTKPVVNSRAPSCATAWADSIGGLAKPAGSRFAPRLKS